MKIWCPSTPNSPSSLISWPLLPDLFEIVAGDVHGALPALVQAPGRVHGALPGLLQALEAPLQGPHEALPEVIHRADEFVSHGLVEPGDDQLLDLLDAAFDVLGADRLAILGDDDVCREKGLVRKGILREALRSTNCSKGCFKNKVLSP